MQTYYYQLAIAFLLAQLLMASLNVYNYQKEKNIDYYTSLKIYFRAEIGYFIIGFFAISVVMFILPEFVNLSITREDLLSKEKLTWKENLQLWFKCIFIVVGGFVQYIAFVYKKKGKIAIDKVADKV